MPKKRNESQFPGFKACMVMMRKHDAETQEGGFYLLEPHAAAYFPELVTEFEREQANGSTLRFWLLDLIAQTRAPEALEILTRCLYDPKDTELQYTARAGLKKLDTKEARQTLWESECNLSDAELATLQSLGVLKAD